MIEKLPTIRQDLVNKINRGNSDGLGEVLVIWNKLNEIIDYLNAQEEAEKKKRSYEVKKAFAKISKVKGVEPYKPVG